MMALSATEPGAIDLFGISLHAIRLKEAIALLISWMESPARCRYVVTPNVDHIVKLQHDAAMRRAYQHASLVVADGWPLVKASRWLGCPLPERVAGSDLVPGVLAASNSMTNPRVFLLGGAPGVAEGAAQRICSKWPHVQICGVASPPFGFEVESEESRKLIAEVNAVEPHLLIVGLGAPKQEIWLAKHAPQLNVSVAIAAGATIDFLAGVQTRAPRWVQKLGLEWFFRLATDPKRLAGRYARDAVVFPQLVVGEWRRRKTKSSAS